MTKRLNDATPEEWDKAAMDANMTVTGKLHPGRIIPPGDVDMVKSPGHYKEAGKQECIDYLSERLNPIQMQGYLNGNILKYMHRWQDKNGVEDLRKARWYLDRLIKELL